MGVVRQWGLAWLESNDMDFLCFENNAKRKSFVFFIAQLYVDGDRRTRETRERKRVQVDTIDDSWQRHHHHPRNSPIDLVLLWYHIVLSMLVLP